MKLFNWTLRMGYQCGKQRKVGQIEDEHNSCDEKNMISSTNDEKELQR